MAPMAVTDRIRATYFVETPLAVSNAAAVLAGEQSSATFVDVPGETADLRQRFAAQVERITDLGSVPAPSLPGCRPTKGPYQRALVEVSWPWENVGYNLPTLVSTVGGNLFELSQFSGLRLTDLEFPASFVSQFCGPHFGIAGTRAITQVAGRPLIGTIIKPSIGLRPVQTAELARTLIQAGIDFIKDDELMANPPHSPFDERVDAVLHVVKEEVQRTGKRVMVAFM